MELTAEHVRIAYTLFFGRQPESDAAVQNALGYGTLERLREACLNSLEFEMLLNRLPRLVRGDAPPLPSDWRAKPATARALLATLRAAWAETPPGLPADAGAVRDPSGTLETGELLGCVRRSGLDPATLGQAFVFGCGGGRVSAVLAGHFASVGGCDLSPLRVAAANEAGGGPYAAVGDLRFGMTGAFDLWYSHLTLQCYPPPLIGQILERALALLRPGGVAVFQMATYGYGYRFDPSATPRADPSVDRHVLPQPAVFAIGLAAGCVPSEAYDDLAVMPNPLWRSTVCVLRKPG